MSISRMEERILKRIALDYEIWVENNEVLDGTIKTFAGVGMSHYVTDIIITSTLTTPLKMEIAQLGNFIISREGGPLCHAYNAPIRMGDNAAIVRVDEATSGLVHVQLVGFTGPFRFDN